MCPVAEVGSPLSLKTTRGYNYWASSTNSSAVKIRSNTVKDNGPDVNPFFSPLALLASKVLAHFTAPADLIPINPVIVDVAGGGHCCQFFRFQLSPPEWHFGMKATSSQMEWRFPWEDIKIVTKSWQGALWRIMTNLQTKRKFPKLQKQMQWHTCQLGSQQTAAEALSSNETERDGDEGGRGRNEEAGSCRIRHKIHHVCQSEKTDWWKEKLEGNGFITGGCTAPIRQFQKCTSKYVYLFPQSVECFHQSLSCRTSTLKQKLPSPYHPMLA